MLKSFGVLSCASAFLMSAAYAQVAPPGFNRPAVPAPAPAPAATVMVAPPLPPVAAVLPSDTIIQVPPLRKLPRSR